MQAFMRQATAASAVVVSLWAATVSHAALTLTFTETVSESDIGRDREVLVISSAPLSLIDTALDVLAGSYSQTIPGIGTIEADGKPFTPVTADFSTDTVFTFRIVAPAGQHFLVHEDATLDFVIHFFDASAAVDLLEDTALAITLDGVPLTLDNIGAVGIHGDGESFLFEGGADLIPAGTTFSELAFTIDYSEDANGPVTITSGEDTLQATASSYVAFTHGEPTTSTIPSIGPIISVVPEPAALTLLLPAALATPLRRRRK